MSRSLAALTPEFKASVEELLARVALRGVTMVPYETMRTPDQQARFWRQSRTTAQIREAIALLRKHNAPWLAGVLDAVGPQSGPHVTNALPGQSWHQWGLAVDCYWEHPRGRAEWSTSKFGDANGYRIYGAVATEMGLFSLGHSRGWDWPHVQGPKASSPTRQHTWAEIDQNMKRRFG